MKAASTGRAVIGPWKTGIFPLGTNVFPEWTHQPADTTERPHHNSFPKCDIFTRKLNHIGWGISRKLWIAENKNLTLPFPSLGLFQMLCSLHFLFHQNE
jgi:hypothetical protein